MCWPRSAPRGWRARVRLAIRLAVADFHAVEHRLEFVANINGVDYYNDSKATNVDATTKAIESFPGNIHLILGGKDKNSDYSLLSPLLRERVKAVYTIGAAAEKIETQIRGAVPIHVVSSHTLQQAVANAASAAHAGRRSCCWRRRVPALTNLKTTNIAGRVFKDIVLEGRRLGVWQNA